MGKVTDEQIIEKTKKKASRRDSPLSPLERILSEDRNLKDDPSKLRTMLALARLFDSDLKANLNLHAFDLDDKYDTFSPQDWLEFKNYGAVVRYINNYIMDMQAIEAQKKITSDGIRNTRDAITLQDSVEEKRKKDQNTNVIIFFMPQKDYTK